MAHTLKSSRDLRQRFDLYLNEAEIEQVRAVADAARLPMSTYLRRVALRQRIEVVPPIGNVERWRELAPLANNLNQIARACNAGHATAEIYPALVALSEQVRLLRLDLLGATDAANSTRGASP